eukprot:CAMPEP_0194754718 /NCGR_PEP_ID=MMETSP0323_2-20130528/8648_1 /TAXON_ID=2866 ORGANISM="Crypthecodinium cohnii, Strain Seligo" /NCGR_SAMPLE_ID=MMETSP0323_2 /ASSEMBLY_ACC=CAM_ASM_000346 /LENGTH=217 /DNA_ID=CAMNT_0039673399 /DNA_START=40 /DNA_END=693 /DNA_ORIENTATION=-
MDGEAKITADTLEFLRNSCWCYSCCICGDGCASFFPLIQSRNKCLCCQQTQTSEEEICGPKGCHADTSKFLCLTSHAMFPPENVRIGLCNFFCMGGPPQAPPDMGMDLSAVSEAFWLYYCCCSGYGLTTKKVMDPMVAGYSKCCCIYSTSYTTDVGGPRGLVSVNQKTCCCTHYTALPPTMTPGIGCCNKMFAGNNLYDGARGAIGAPPQTEMGTSH